MSQHNVRLAILCLTCISSLALIGCVLLALLGGHDSGGLCTVAGAGLGALAAMLLPPRPPNGRNGNGPGPTPPAHPS